MALQWAVNKKSSILYVKNRVEDMINTDPGCFCHHLISQDNLANLLSRGLGYDEFIANATWRCGPEWFNDQDQGSEQKLKTLVEHKEITAVPGSNSRFKLKIRYNS